MGVLSFSGKRAERRMSARNRLCKAAEKRDGRCRGGDGGPGNSCGELGKCGEKTGAGPGRSVEIEKDDFCFPAAEENAGKFFSLYSAAERKIFRYERGADWAKVKRRNLGEGGRRRQRRSFSALGRGRLLAEAGRLPCRLKCGKGPRKDALFCRAACGAQSGAGIKQSGSIFSGIFKAGRLWDGRIQRAEACGKAAALCGEGTAAGRSCFVAGIFLRRGE